MPGPPAGSTLESLLRHHTRPREELVRREDSGALRCLACAHQCLIRDGQSGICKVRFHVDGQLLVPWGYTAGLALDPIEKKPFYHVFPGDRALSFGMLGCDMRCGFCQNWYSSQTLRDPAATHARIVPATPEQIVQRALDEGAPAIVSTYNEPLITAEWAAELFDLAQEKGLVTGFVSNGNANSEVLDFLTPRLDLFKVDLKSFQDGEYRRLGARLASVLSSIEGALARGLWVEVVTLIVPGLNDTAEELAHIARYLAALSPSIPWHVSAFHPDYKMQDRTSTPSSSLLRALDAGRAAGLHYVYPGNHRGLANHESTPCPGCGETVIERQGWQVGRVLLEKGHCLACGSAIPGIWNDARVGLGR